MALLADDIADLITGTLKRLGKMRFTQIATRLQSYECMGRLLKSDRVTFGDGVGIRRNIMLDHSAAARMVGLYEVDNVNVSDIWGKIEIPWRHTETHYAYEHRELLMNNGVSRINDITNGKRVDAMISLAELCETQVWEAPSGTSDTTHVFGFPYWITQSDTTGFYGTNHASFTAGKGGLSSSDAPRWVNYTGKYINVSYADLITLMRTGYMSCMWKTPVDINDYRRGAGQQYRIYCPLSVALKFDDAARGQNDDLGPDVAVMDGKSVFRGHPIIWVPKLDSVSNAPVYMLNFADIGVSVLRGDYLRETGPQLASNMHNVHVVFVDLTWNLFFNNLRTHAVFTTAAA